MNTSKSRHIAPLAVLAAALIGAGAAYAATKLHGSSTGTPASAGSLSGTPIASGGAATARGSATNSDDHGGPGFRHGPGGGGDELTAAAGYLGVTETALLTQLQAGKTLAQVADATSGKSAAGLIDALVAAEKTEIAAAVTAGRLTPAQADQLTATLKARFTALANGTRPGHDGDSHEGSSNGSPNFKSSTGGTHI